MQKEYLNEVRVKHTSRTAEHDRTEFVFGLNVMVTDGGLRTRLAHAVDVFAVER